MSRAIQSMNFISVESTEGTRQKLDWFREVVNFPKCYLFSNQKSMLTARTYFKNENETVFLKWYYDQKIIIFSLDLKTMLAKH